MTPQEHIKLLTTQAEDDFGAADALAIAGYYGQSLFWAHLVLEKLCKALWVKNNNDIDYPYIHNLIKLLKEAGIRLSQQQIEFYTEMNQFQAQGRYADELQMVEGTVSKEICYQYLENVKTERQWLLAGATKIATDFVNACIKIGIPVKEAVLFGSFVKGKADRNSDIDLALVSESFGRNIIINSKQTALLNWEYPDIEVHHFNTKDFQWDTSPFINEIIRTGIKIYG